MAQKKRDARWYAIILSGNGLTGILNLWILRLPAPKMIAATISVDFLICLGMCWLLKEWPFRRQA